MEKTCIFLLAKNPLADSVKPELDKVMGLENALKIYLSLLDITANTIKLVPIEKAVFYQDTIINEDMFGFVENKHKQTEGDWGKIIQNAFQTLFSQGFEKVIYIDEDCPLLSTEHIKQAVEGLNLHDVAMGPSLSGGYYLLGLKNTNTAIFENKIWGSNQVFEQTLKEFHDEKKKVFLLEALFNVNTLEDLQRYLSFILNQKNALNPLFFKDRPQ